jgi:hypothetical protein
MFLLKMFSPNLSTGNSQTHEEYRPVNKTTDLYSSFSSSPILVFVHILFKKDISLHFNFNPKLISTRIINKIYVKLWGTHAFIKFQCYNLLLL